VCPSYMAVASLADQIVGYNNEILVATAAMSPVTYQTLNIEKRPPLPIPPSDRLSIPGSSVTRSDTRQPVPKER